MSLRDLSEKLERRARLLGVLMILAIVLILSSFLMSPIAVYPYRLLMLLTGTIVLAVDLYFIMTEEKILTRYGIAPEKVPKKPRGVLRPADVFSTILRASLYAVFVFCFFLVGLFYPSLSWPSWLIFPLFVSFFFGYLVDNLKKVAIIILVGYVIVIIIALTLFVIPFWEAYRSCFLDIVEFFNMGPLTEETALGCAILTTASFMSFQVPLGFFAAYVGAYIKNRQ